MTLTVLLMLMCLLFGVAGFSMNLVFASTSLTPIEYVWISILVALVVMIFLTALLAPLFARIIPGTTCTGYRARDLVGCTGTVTIDATQSSGMAQVTHERKNVQVYCRARNGTIAAGKEVQLTDYLENDKLYVVDEGLFPGGRAA